MTETSDHFLTTYSSLELARDASKKRKSTKCIFTWEREGGLGHIFVNFYYYYYYYIIDSEILSFLSIGSLFPLDPIKGKWHEAFGKTCFPR